MKDSEPVKRIAVLIDAENTQHRTIGAVLEEISKHGNALAKNAYGDWSAERLKGWPTVLERHAISAQHQFARTSGKNALDIALVIDAMDMFHSEHFDAFALVSSDADFAGLAARLRRGGKFVLGFGEDKTPASFRSACDVFVLPTLPAEPRLGVQPGPAPGSRAEKQAVLDLLRSATAAHGDAAGWTLASVAGSMLKQQRPDFDPKSLQCRSLLRLIDRFGDVFERRHVPRGKGMADEYRERPAG